MNKIWKYLIAVLVAVALFFGGMLLERKFQNDRYKEVKRPNPTRHSKSNS